MKRPKISIIVLSYNNAKHYQECLFSVLQQTYSNIELIIGDDCSREFPREEIETYIANHKKNNIQSVLIYQNEENFGVVKNYKKAIEQATGEYIFYLAMDDLFYDNAVLKNVVFYFEKTGLQIFTGYRENFDERGNCNIQPILLDAELFSTTDMKKKRERLVRTAIVMGCCTPFRKSLVERYGFGEDEYTHLEDWPRYLKLLESGVDIGFLDKTLVKYRMGGITGEIKNKDLIKDFAHFYSKYMFPPYSDMFESIKNRKNIVGWGTANNFIRSYSKLVEYTGKELSFLVDANEMMQGKKLCGYTIKSPEEIVKLEKNDTFVVVFCTGYYQEIAEQLEGWGYREGIDFDVFIEARGCYVDQQGI